MRVSGKNCVKKIFRKHQDSLYQDVAAKREKPVNFINTHFLPSVNAGIVIFNIDTLNS